MTSFANHLVSPCSLEKAVLPSAVAKRNADSKPRFSASKSQRSTAGRTRPSSGGWINVSEREKFGVSSWKKTFASDFLNPLNGLGACKLQRRVQITFRGRRRNRGASATLAERHAKSTTVWPNQSSPSTFEENYILSGTSKIEGRISIKVLSVKGEEKIRVVIGCDLPGSWILHWGVINAQTSSREWNQPPVSMRPPGTALIKDYAVETPLLCAAFPSPPGEGLPLCHVEIDIRKCDAPDAIHFVLKDEETGRWYKHDGKDFVIRIPPTLFTQEISGAVKTANIIEDLLTSSNVKASPWSGFFDVMIHMLHLLKDTEKTNSDHLVSTDQVPKMSNAWNGNGVVLEETDHSILKKTKTQNRLKVSVQNAEGDLRVVSFDTDLKGQTILHWGLSKSDRGKWELPPDNMHPPNTTIYKEKAVQTPLQEKEDGNGSFGMLYVGGCYKGLKFVLNHAETNCWLDNEGKDFYVPLSFDRSFEDYGRFSEAKTVTKFDALDAETEDIRKGQLDDIRADLEKHAVLVVNVTEHQIIQDGLKSPVREEHKVLPRKFNEVEQKFEADAATDLLKEAETTLVSLPMTSLVTEHLSSEKGKGEIHNLEDVFEHELVLLEEEDQMKKASDLESQTEKLDSLHPTKEIENVDLKTDTSNGVIKLFLEESNVEIDHTKQGSTSSDLFQFEETLLNNAAKEGTSSQSNASSHFVGDSTSTSLSYKDASAILQNSELEITARSLDFDIPTMDKFQLTGNHLLEVDELAAEAYERFKASPPAPAEEKDHRLQVWRPKGKACSGTGSGTEVLLQGFNWESHRTGRWYDIICEQSAELASCGFTVMWLPPPTESISPEGYMPKDLYNLNSRYGSMEGLKKVVQKLHDVGIKVLGDAVLNHRCAHYRNHNGIWNIFGGRLNWDDRAIVSDDPHFQGRGNRSSGDNFHAAPNIDHSQEFVRRDLTEWLRWLRNEVGYDGWRLDYVRGFWGGYVKDYIEGSQPYFAVGEYWDSLSYAYGKIDYNQDAHRQRIVDWINATGGNAGAFDVTTKGILHAAFEKCEYWRLADTKRKPPGVVGWWPSRAVTFIENHDTGSTQGHWRFPAGKEMQGYAYILTHPGTPTVFYDHLFSHHREEIRSLVALRKRAGIHCRSLINIEKAEKDVYAAKIDDQVLMKIGPGHYQPPSAGKKWILTTEGRDYKVWEAL